MVLPCASQRLSTNGTTHHANCTDCTSASSRPLQLCRWLCELAGGMECREKELVLSCAWKRVPRTDWMRNNIKAVRLSCRVCKLDGRLVSSKKSWCCTNEGKGCPPAAG